jgi:hypothetical protein
MVIRQRFGPDEAARLLAKRYQILVGWCPRKTILRDPFAVCDARSVLEEELVPIKLIYPNREAESFSIRPPLEGRTDEGHKWYYLHKQTPEEVLIFKIFDSKTSVSRRAPHSAFVDKEYEKEDPHASLEIRALVFYDDDNT